MKKYLAIFFLTIILLGLAGTSLAITTIVDYPEIPGAIEPSKEAGQTLPQFIKYIYLFALGIVGVTGFLAIIFAAFGYVTSVGNPQKASDAKDRIISALLGIFLLLGSAALLNLINPDLLKLKMPENQNVEIKIASSDTNICCFETASVDKPSINEGESINFILTVSEACSNVPSSSLLANTKIRLKQVESGERNTDYSRFCGTFSRDNLKLKTSCYFKKESFDNENKGKPEYFYIEGSVRVENGQQQYIPRLIFQVNDLTNAGTCCR